MFVLLACENNVVLDWRSSLRSSGDNVMYCSFVVVA